MNNCYEGRKEIPKDSVKLQYKDTKRKGDDGNIYEARMGNNTQFIVLRIKRRRKCSWYPTVIYEHFDNNKNTLRRLPEYSDL